MDVIKINFDQLQKDNWSAKERKNAQFMVEFIQLLMNNHDLDQIKAKYGDSPYVQHNRNMETGMEGIIKEIKTLIKNYPEYTYDVKHIYADGDYIIFHSHATIKKKDRGQDRSGFNIKDTWKIEDRKIVEHWDAIQPLNTFMRFYAWLVGGKLRNTNGVF